MNTRIFYQYRDADNYKNYSEVIINGVLLLDDIKCFFRDGEFFIPSEVGLEDLQVQPLSVVDHIWHEITDLSNTEDVSNCDLNSEQLLKNFRYADSIDWNETAVFKRKGIL